MKLSCSAGEAGRSQRAPPFHVQAEGTHLLLESHPCDIGDGLLVRLDPLVTGEAFGRERGAGRGRGLAGGDTLCRGRMAERAEREQREPVGEHRDAVRRGEGEAGEAREEKEDSRERKPRSSTRASSPRTAWTGQRHRSRPDLVEGALADS